MFIQALPIVLSPPSRLGFQDNVHQARTGIRNYFAWEELNHHQWHVFYECYYDSGLSEQQLHAEKHGESVEAKAVRK